MKMTKQKQQEGLIQLLQLQLQLQLQQSNLLVQLTFHFLFV